MQRAAAVCWIGSLKKHVEVLTRSISECDLIWNKVLADVIKMRFYWIRVSPTSNHWYPYKEREIWDPETHTGRRWPWKGGGRDRSHTATIREGQGLLATISSHEREGRIFPESLWRECGQTNTMILDLEPLELKRIHSRCSNHPIWGAL